MASGTSYILSKFPYKLLHDFLTAALNALDKTSAGLNSLKISTRQKAYGSVQNLSGLLSHYS